MPLLPALLAFVSSCRSSGSYPEPASSSSTSGYVSSLGSSISSPSFSASEGFSAPSRVAAKGELVVRPDVIVMVFAVKDTQADPKKAVSSMQAYSAEVGRKLQEATSGAATMKMCGVSVQISSKGKTDDGEATEYALLADGRVEVALSAEQDFWARSRLLASLTQTARDLVSAARASKSGPGIHFSEPRVEVKDPEGYRPKLMERWMKRARELADANQSAAAPLYLVDCAPPGLVEQRPISLEEIGLSLAVTCRVDVLRSTKND